MKKLTLADLKRAAAGHGGTVEGGVIGRHGSYKRDAPDGQRWSCSAVHALALCWWANEDGSPTWPSEKQDAITDAIERISDGVETCDDPDCGYCRPEEG